MTTSHHTATDKAAPARDVSTHNGATQKVSARTSPVNDGADDSHWAPPRLSAVRPAIILEDAAWNSEQLAKLQVLMDVHGFEAAYLVNRDESTHSTIVGNRSSVTKAQIATVCASLQVSGFDQLTLCLSDVHILARHMPNLPNHACVMIIDRDQSNSAVAMNSLKKFCRELT